MNQKSNTKRVLASRIRESAVIPGIRLFTAPTSLPDGIVMTGSTPAGVFAAGEKSATAGGLAMRMLGQSTARRSREEVREELESRGISLDYSADTHRLRFSIRALARDLDHALRILAEQLTLPAFRANELAQEKKLCVAEIEQSEEYPKVRAERRFSQILYPRAHPNHIPPAKTGIARVKKCSRADLVAFHREHYGGGEMLIAAGGAVSHPKIADALAGVFGAWRPDKKTSPDLSHKTLAHGAREEFITMRDKTSVDIMVGSGLPFDRKHPDFLALAVGISILGHGGGFLGRLMREVREKEGLTYGIYAATHGGVYGIPGHWAVWGTFAPALFERGRASLLRELTLWKERGITDRELALFKEAIGGGYTVGLASAAGIASSVLTNAEQGYALDYLDEYLDQLDALDTESVNRVIKTYIDINSLITVAAGAIDAKGNPL